MLHEVELNSLDVSNLMWDIQKTCVTNEDIEYLWEIKQVWLVRNKELTERYERKRKLMKSLGRTEEETKDDLLFMAEGFNNVQRICEIGPRCKEKKNNVLGDTQYGIHMNRHYDILTRFMVFKNFQQANYLVILRGMLGRVKKVKPFFTGEYGCIAPTPNYDCHLAENAPDLTSIDISDAIAYNFAYMYEYDEETIIPMNYPSHVLPIAVLRLHRTRNRLDRTVLLNYTRERDLALSKNIQRLKNETKPLKHLPRSAPHKKYVVEGRRSGTRLISDVPIEPPSEKPPGETTKKLEKFRRPSALSGGTGMGYMFFRRPFNKMPTTWQRMFGFHSKRKGKSSHSPKKRVRDRSRSRSQNREPEKRKRSRTRSPKSSSSKSREKNLFELFDNSKQNQTSDSSSDDEKSNNGVTKQTTKCVVVDKKPSISSIDTGCKKTVDQKSSGNHTPTQDERQCNDVNIDVSSIKEHGRNTGSDPYVRHDSQLSRTCLDQKRQTIQDHGSTKSRELSNSVTPERKPSDHGSPHVDAVKVASSETRKRSASSKDNETDLTYKLVRITLDEPDAPSIYHELRGIRIPSGEKKTVKDPRILRAMGHVIETPVMAGFGPFLRRIKEEPPEDESYGEKSEKRTKNILPVEFIKTEPENEQTEDDVEKALNELNNAIKAIQNNSSVDTDVVKIKKEPGETENCTDGKTRAEAQSGKQTDKERDRERESNTDDFLPRNMGFSSYLPEYNDDFERTARVLTEVFSEKAASPTKKVHMSMSDYFGSSNPNVYLNSTNKGNIEGKLSDINSSCKPTRSVQVPKENAEKKENNSGKAKELIKTKSSAKILESNKKEKHNEKISTTSTTYSKTVKQKKYDSKHSIASEKQKTKKPEFDSNEKLNVQRNKSRSLKTRSRSRSPASQPRKRPIEIKRKRSRSRSLSKSDRDRGRTRSKSPHLKRNKQEKHFSRSPSLDKSSFRSRPESHHSRERRRSRSVSPFCSRSNSSQDSGTKSSYKMTSNTSKDSKSTKRSLAEEIFERENSPGRLKYLEERKKIDISRRFITKAKHYKEEITKLYNDHTGGNMSNPMAFSNMQMRPEDNLNIYNNHRSSYVDLTMETETRFSERKQPTTNDEAVVNTTLSKAMTSLLKKIVFRDSSNQDDSAEGRMADMVIELVKDQMSKELKSEVMPTIASTAAQPVHPFVPYLKQERSVESLYTSNPWHSTMSDSATNEVSSGLDFPDDFLEQHYHDERADSGTNVSYSPRAPFMQRVHSGFSQPDHHSNTPHTTFRGKLLSLKTTKKTRGSSYRGRLSSSRGSFQTRGFRGSYRSRSGGHSNHRSSSYHRTFKDNSSYDKR